MARKWWADGIRFECQGSGKCCLTRGNYGFVYVTLEDRRRFARWLRIPTGEFTRRYCRKSDGYFHLISGSKSEDCVFLQGTRCGAYEARPTQCRTWPFWPENMSPKAWNTEVKSYCPGVGKGRVIRKEEIERALDLQQKSEECL